MKLTNESGEEFRTVGPYQTAEGEDGFLVVPIKKDWPKEGGIFWFVDVCGDAQLTEWRNDTIDEKLKEQGNIWRTKEEAEAVDKIYKEVNRVVRENSDWVSSTMVELIREAQNIVKESK